MQENIRKAQMYCEYVVREHENLLPIAPHIYLTQFLDDANEKDREFGLKAGLFLLSECDELWYFGHQITSGMTDEICYAMKNGIPVRYVPEENYEKYTTERMNFNEIQF